MSVALASAAGVAGLLLAFGAPSWLQAAGAIPALAAGVRLAWPAEPARPTNALDAALTLAVGVATLAWAVRLFGPGVLPVGDPIAVPQFARTLAVGSSLADAFPPGTSGHAYPPGYPLLLAPLEAWLRPDQALMAFKAITILVVALIPLAWSGLHQALFPLRLPTALVAAVASGAFIVAERHLGFLTPFAGKNAVEFALLLFPGVALATIRLCEDPRRWPFAAVPLLGLFLIHYSMLHLAIAVLGAYALLGRPWRWDVALKMGAAGALAAGLLLLAAGEALHDPRAVAAAWAPAHALGGMARGLLAKRSELVVFHDADFGLEPATYRMLALAACAAIAGTVGLWLRQAALWRSAAVYALAIAVSLAFGYGLAPARISFDFVRCYLWPLQAMLFATAALAALQGWRAAGWPWKVAGLAAAAPASFALLTVAANDMRVERETFSRLTQPRAAMRQIAQALPQARPCLLITHGQARPDVLVTVQDAAAWNYAEALSPCAFVGGSWVHSGWPGGRALDGLPSAATLRTLPSGIPIYFVGTQGQVRAYADALSAEGVTWTWRLAAPNVAGVSLWQADVARQEQAEAGARS